MKKFILASLAATALVTTAVSADTTTHINLGGSNYSVNGATANGFNVGFGATRVWDSGILATFDLGYGQADISGDSVKNYGGDIKVGYKWKAVAVYGIGSAIYGSLASVTTAGFGYGAGFEVDTPWEYLGVGVDYTKYSMTPEVGPDFDMDIAKAYLSIHW